MADSGMARLGLIAIGRNEGDRLRRCFQSIPREVPIAYVDSASTDGSVAVAEERGALVVALDMSLPFSAARARNEGFDKLREASPDIEFVQFIDGDCELDEGWLGTAIQFLEREPEFAVVCGRRRERFPGVSFYNAMADQEWNTPVGEADACGGDAMMRVSAVIEAGRYDSAIIAGEEPELCLRLRTCGWRIWRLDSPMTIHDADMHHFGQWWMRAVRSGYGYAQVWWKTRRSSDPLYQRQVISALFWTAGIVALALVFAALMGWPALILPPLLWATQLARLAKREGAKKAWHLMVGKFAETIGITRFLFASFRRRNQSAIFYK